jgi:hypothetical protein
VCSVCTCFIVWRETERERKRKKERRIESKREREREWQMEEERIFYVPEIQIPPLWMF